MGEVHISLRHGDVRDEEFKRFGSTLARFGPEPQVPSPNLKRVIDNLERGKLSKIALLADKIEAGNATGEEDESLEVYESLAVLMDHVRDLTDMCRRREQALAELDIGIGR